MSGGWSWRLIHEAPCLCVCTCPCVRETACRCVLPCEPPILCSSSFPFPIHSFHSLFLLVLLPFFREVLCVCVCLSLPGTKGENRGHQLSKGRNILLRVRVRRESMSLLLFPWLNSSVGADLGASAGGLLCLQVPSFSNQLHPFLPFSLFSLSHFSLLFPFLHFFFPQFQIPVRNQNFLSLSSSEMEIS